jgi:tetratricopeptide (TPR) repeat protein
MSRAVIAVATLLAFVAASLPRGAAAQPAGDPEAMQQAKVHFEAGRSAYQAADYQGAIREFKAAQTLRPSPVLDFNIGLAYEALGKLRAAEKYYRRYLEGRPDAQNRPEVEAKLQSIDQRIAVERQPAVNEDPGAQPPPIEGQPQYQYGGDPYWGVPVQPPPPKAKKKSSYWWIVFPILGGVTLITLVVLYFWWSVSTVYGGGALSTPPAGGAPRTDDSSVLFRF